MFDVLSSAVDSRLDINLLSEMLARLINLRNEFLMYFPEIYDVDLNLMRKLFAIPVEKVSDDLQDELIEYRNDSACKSTFDPLSVCEFWAGVCVFYPHIRKECIIVLLPVSCTYLCESGFSILLQMKTKVPNRLK